MASPRTIGLIQRPVRASDASTSVKNMLDGKVATRWSIPLSGEEWIEIDFDALLERRKQKPEKAGWCKGPIDTAFAAQFAVVGKLA